MKKYKLNYMFTVMFQLCNMFLSFFPGLLIISLFINPEDPLELHKLLFIGILFTLLYIIFGNIIHFIISIFTKYKVFIDDQTITIKGKNIVTENIKLDDIKFITFDHGIISKGRNIPCSITLFNHNKSKYITINSPSFLMICEIQKRCKNAKYKFNNYKWYIILCSCFTVFSIFICILANR